MMTGELRSTDGAPSVAEWMTCKSRSHWAVTSLGTRISEMRRHEAMCRAAYRTDWMGVPATYLADAYAEAATVFQRRLDEILASNASPEELSPREALR